MRAIVEQKSLTPEEETVPEINSGIYAFATRESLSSYLGDLNTDNAHGEYYLTDMARLAGGGERARGCHGGRGPGPRFWVQTPLRK